MSPKSNLETGTKTRLRLKRTLLFGASALVIGAVVWKILFTTVATVSTTTNVRAMFTPGSGAVITGHTWQGTLVEDHPINQMLAMKVLKDWNIDVALAENGRIALEMVAKDDYDLILMDISMPEMDGYTATKEIRSGNHTHDKDIPIIAMTASALIGENQKCFKAGMNDYITKPFEPENLMEKIYNNLHITHLKSA